MKNTAITIMAPRHRKAKLKTRLASQLILLVGGLAVFMYVVFLEGYYRESVAGKAPRRSSSDASARAPQMNADERERGSEQGCGPELASTDPGPFTFNRPDRDAHSAADVALT